MIRHSGRKSVRAQLSALESQESLPFKDVLTLEEINETVSRDSPDFRDRVFSPLTTILAFISQALSPDGSCRKAVAKVNSDRIASGIAPASPNTSAYVQARERLSESSIRSLACSAAAKLETQIPEGWLWKGRHVKVVDGSGLTMADTPDNQAAYPQQAMQKPGCGFPTLRVVAVMSLVTGAILDFAMAPYKGKKTGECTLFRTLLECFSPRETVLGDGYYGTFFVFVLLQQIAVDGVFKIHGSRNVDFKRGRRLGQRDHVVKWERPPQKPVWIDRDDYDALPSNISILEVEIRVERPGFRTKTFVIVTTFLDSHEVTKDELAALFRRRWYGELYLRNIKTTMGMDHLSCKTPAMVRKEVWIHILTYNLICRLVSQAAYVSDVMPCQISFKGAIDTLDEYAKLWMPVAYRDANTIYALLLQAIGKMRVANRPDRIEPRAIKRRRKQAYDLLNKPRAQARQEHMQHR